MTKFLCILAAINIFCAALAGVLGYAFGDVDSYIICAFFTVLLLATLATAMRLRYPKRKKNETYSV